MEALFKVGDIVHHPDLGYGVVHKKEYTYPQFDWDTGYFVCVFGTWSELFTLDGKPYRQDYGDTTSPITKVELPANTINNP